MNVLPWKPTLAAVGILATDLLKVVLQMLRLLIATPISRVCRLNLLKVVLVTVVVRRVRGAESAVDGDVAGLALTVREA